jgi:hypothetical protein
MNIQHKLIQLEAPTKTRIIKRLALTAFSGVRVVASALSQLPEVTTLTAHDIRDAWIESAIPKQ